MAGKNLMRIALIEDNSSLAKGISYRLEDVGHAVDVLTDGDEAARFLRSEAADLIIMDINLPGVDGLTILRDLRQRGDTRPVILLTAKAETQDRVIGLDAGADDYLIKPFEMAELEARVRALLRRRAQPHQARRQFGRLTYDQGTRQIYAGGVEIDLPRREMSAFECLLEAEGRLVSKSALLDHIYGVGTDVEETVVEVYISRLRSKLADYGVQIKTRRGLGYHMTSEPS